jgi:hypothetical protein
MKLKEGIEEVPICPHVVMPWHNGNILVLIGISTWIMIIPDMVSIPYKKSTNRIQ